MSGSVQSHTNLNPRDRLYRIEPNSPIRLLVNPIALPEYRSFFNLSSPPFSQKVVLPEFLFYGRLTNSLTCLS